jgi:enoyl-CoA hydratase/carnithine racemase
MSQFPVALPSKDNHQMTLSQEGPLFILHLHHKDNRFNTEFCQAILKALQIVEDYFLAQENPVDMALVTYGNDKIFSNGLDLFHALEYTPFMDIYLSVLRRLVTFCIPTVAAING